MLNRVFPTILYNVVKTNDIGLNVCIWVHKTMPNTCLCSEIYNNVKLLLSKNIFMKNLIRYIPFDKWKFRVCWIFYRNTFFHTINSEFFKPGIFQVYIIIIIDTIQPNYFMSFIQEPCNCVKTNETCSTCKEDFQ